ncbi:MAG TPA: hypothetical protein VGD29_32325 [Actinoplanes sp.]
MSSSTTRGRPGSPACGKRSGCRRPHLANALWKDGRLTALLDFEWVRLGPPDLEIEPYLRADVTGLPH